MPNHVKRHAILFFQIGLVAFCKRCANNARMKTNQTITEIRLANLKALIAEHGDNVAEVVRACKSKNVQISNVYLSQILTRSTMPSGKTREVGTELARKLEKGCDKPTGWMDTGIDYDDPGEVELRNIFTAISLEQRGLLLEQARLMVKMNRK